MGSAPMDPSQAVKALEDAADREQIFGLLLRAARSKTRFAALLSVHSDHVRGRRAIAEDGFDTDPVAELRIPRNTVPAFETAVTSGTPYVGPLATGEKATDKLLQRLGGKLPKDAVVLPLTIGTRTVALVVGHRGKEGLELDDVAELFPLVEAMSPALARLLSSRAEVAAEKPALRVGSAPAISSPSPAPAAPAAAPGPPPPQAVAEFKKHLATLRKQQAWEELAEGIRALIRVGMETGDPDEDEQLGLLYELGTIEAEHLFRPELAIEAWRSAQTIDAGDIRVIEALEKLYVQQARWEDCVELLEKRAALTEKVKDRVDFLLDVAEMARERLDDEERAVGAYERILQWDPGHEQAGKELEDLYFARKQWEPLSGLLLDRASRLRDDKAGIAALESVAAMYEDKVGDPHAAVLVWLAVLRRDPTRVDVVEQLERLGTAAGGWDEILPEVETVAEKLDRKEPAAAARMWRQIGRWKRDHLGNRDDAMRALDRAARLEPNDVEAMTEVLDILRVDGPWFELATVLARRAELEPSRREQSELYAELADVYESRLGQPVEAVTYFEKALASDPGSKAVLMALRRLHRQAEAWDALAKVLVRLVEVLGNDSGRAEVIDTQVELGTLYAEKLGRPEDAVRAFKSAQALDAKNLAAFHGLEQVYQTTGQTEQLLETTEAELDAQGADQAHRYADLAAAWDDLVGRHDRAAAAWQKLLARDPQNHQAHQALARVLAKAGAWPELAAALRAYLKIVPAHARTAVLLELAGVLEGRLGDVDGAIAACQEALKHDPAQTIALDTLGRLYERAGRWKPALDALERLLSTATDKKKRADLLQRIGQVHVSAGDPVKARVSLEQSITLDPDNALSHESMARLHIATGDPAKAGDLLLRAAQRATRQEDAIRCLNDAAWLYRDRLNDPDTARDCLRRVLELEPDHADAKRALAELLHGAGQWESLWPHLQELVAKAKQDPSQPAAERHGVFTQAAHCAMELGNFAAALELYDLACSLDPVHVPTLLERGEVLFRKKAWPEATEAFQSVLARHGGGLTTAQSVQAFRRLAQIHKETARIPQAQAFLQKVLDVDPAHVDTLRDLAELHTGRARWDEAVAAMRLLADAVPEAQRPGVLERVGDLYREKLSNPGKAASTYLAALDVDAGNHRVLQKLLDLQSESGQWKAALDTIDRFLAIEHDPARRGAYLLASANVRRSKLRDEAGALESYEQALDAFFAGEALDEATRARALEAFEAVDELLTATKDWKRQEQAYRRMIKRLPKTEPILRSVWHGLGEIYRTRLKHYESAIEAFEVAHSLDPNKSPERGRILAELYALLGRDVPEKVTDKAARLVEADPTNTDAYRALGQAALRAGKLDEAWCVCRALVFLKKASGEEEAFYRKHRPNEARKATGSLDEDSWANVRHPDEDRTLSAIFAVVWEGAVATRSGPAKSFDLKAKEKMQVEGGTRVVGKIFRLAARTLNAPLPDVYVQPDRPGRLLLASVVEKNRLQPAVIVARDLLAGYKDVEIAAAVGSMLALVRPAYYLRLTMPTVDELEAVIIAAARIAGKQVGRKELEPMVQGVGVEIQKRMNASPQAADTLRGLIARLPAQIDLLTWRNAVDAAARRGGLLVCGDLAASARMASTEGQIAGGPKPSEKVSDLVAYSVSPGYFAARKHLGLSIG